MADTEFNLEFETVERSDGGYVFRLIRRNDAGMFDPVMVSIFSYSSRDGAASAAKRLIGWIVDQTGATERVFGPVASGKTD